MQVGGFVCSMEGYIRQAGGGLFVWWKGSVRFGYWAFRAVEGFRSLWAAGAFLNGGRVPFAHTLFIHGAALTANVSGALPAAPPTPPAPGQQNRRLCRFPRLHFLASGRSGYGILPFPTSGPDYSAHPWASPLRGRRKRRSKALPALLSMRA